VAVLVFKRKPRHALLLCGILLGLFFAETGLYAAFTPYKLGEFQIIFRHHIEEGVPFHVDRFVDLFRRYDRVHLQRYWQVPFLLAAAAAVVYVVRRADRRVIALIAVGASFFLGITFEVAELHPLVPAEGFINRYFTAALVPVFLVLAYAAEGILDRLALRRRERDVSASAGWYVGVLAFLVVAVLGAFSFPRLPSAVREYANSPLRPRSHPLVANVIYRRVINRAFSKGIPIVAVGDGGGDNALETCRNFFVDLDQYTNGRPPAIQQVERPEGTFYVMTRPGASLDGLTFLAAVRLPFRISMIPASALRDLSDDSFSGGARHGVEEVNE